jgi:hypothetical protein
MNDHVAHIDPLWYSQLCASIATSDVFCGCPCEHRVAKARQAIFSLRTWQDVGVYLPILACNVLRDDLCVVLRSVVACF